MTGLPTGWRVVPVAELLAPLKSGRLVQQGWSPQCEKDSATDEQWGVLKTTSIQAGAFDGQHNKRLPADLTPRPELEVKAGDLLMTCAGPRSRCGVPALVKSTRPRLMLSGKTYRFRPNENVCDPRFLEQLLLSPLVQKDIDSLKTGISDSGLNLTHSRFLGMTVPLAPLADQRRIVDILEDHFSSLDAASRNLEAAVRRAAVWQSQLIDAAIWASPDVGPLLPVGQLLAEPMRNGHSAGTVRGNESGIRTLTLTAVTRNEFTDRYTKLTVADPFKVADLWLRAGDVLVQRANTTELVGTTARYEGPNNWAIFPDLLIRLRADESLIRSEYLVAALRSERAHRTLRQKAKGLAGNMPKIDQSAIASTLVSVPELDRQQAIIDRVRELNTTADRIGASLLAAQDRSLALRRGLLNAAFSGRLSGRASDVGFAEEMAQSSTAS